uniref:Mitochondrial amidoxime reducing component 2 n=1 Tax=Sus scrofa TaxID=9823 RepID=A0A8D0R512_PIG
MVCQFLLHSKVTQSYIHSLSPVLLHHVPSQGTGGGSLFHLDPTSQCVALESHPAALCDPSRMFGLDTQGRDCGDEAAQWFTSFLKTEAYRLVQFEKNLKGRRSKKIFSSVAQDYEVAYPDCSPILVISEASLTDLNTRMEKKVKMENFRPNIEVTGCSAFEEDTWGDLLIGDVEMKKVLACGRCILTTVDPDTGVIDRKEPLETLKRVQGLQIQGRDCGEAAAQWITSFLKTQPYRLVHFEPHMSPRNSHQIEHLFRPTDQVAYSDASPFLILSEASLADLNSRLEKKVKAANFRPNIVISGCDAYAEDSWDEILIGDVELKRVMACYRCVLTTVDPDTGIMSRKEPLETLRSYRLCDPSEEKLYGKSPFFGQYFVLENPGTIQVGDPVYLLGQE